MSTDFNYKSFFRENEEEPRMKYWGEKAAGCIFIAKDTGRILLAHRSDQVDFEPYTWGTFGGKLDGDETPPQAVRREVEEETGLKDKYIVHPLYVYKDGEFTYYNYLIVVDFEFSPMLNWENDNSKWVEYGEWPNPLHFGMEALIRHSGTKIKRVIDLFKKKKKKDVSLTETSHNTEGFKHWFGNSKVVKDDGSPLVVYHGTNQPFLTFAKDRRGSVTRSSSAREGYWFTDSTNVASQYAAAAGKMIRSNVASNEKKSKFLQQKVDHMEKHARLTGNWSGYEKAMQEFEDFEINSNREDPMNGQNILPVFLRIENPLVYNFYGQGVNVGEMADLVSQAKAGGHDGMIIKNVADPIPVANHFMVFKSNQIKSAIGNYGKFSKKSNNIIKESMDIPPAIIQKAEKPAATNVVDSVKMNDAYIVVATLWGEARGEKEVGMHAVMNVLMNRAKGNFKKVKDLCIQHKQFSMWNGVSNPEASAIKLAKIQRDGKTSNMDGHMYKKAMELVDLAMKGQLPDITGGATFYFNPKKASPKWAKSMIKTKSIGNHDFYKPVPIVKKAQQIKEDSTSFSMEKQGLVDDGIYGYELKYSTSYLRYGYEPSRRVFYLYNIATPSESDQNKGYAKALLEHFFQIIKQSNGALDTGPFTTSGTAYIKHVVERFAKEYKVRLL